MKRFDSILLKVFLYGLPAVIIFAVFCYCYSTGIVENTSAFFGFLYNFGGLVLGIWIFLSLFLSVRLMVSEQFRDQVIARLTFIRERDEREAILNY